MAIDNFKPSLRETLKHEGGYVDHPRDPGGATNYGITHKTLASWLGRPVTKSEVKNISMSTVQAIYKRKYWDVVKGDSLPAGLDYVTFDAGVNSGPSRGARWTQRAVGAAADGKIGRKTIQASLSAPTIPAIKKACANRLGFVRSLRTFDVFGRGWTRRIAHVEAVAVKMAAAGSQGDTGQLLTGERDKARQAAKRATQGATGTVAAGPASAVGLDLTTLELFGLIGIIVIVAIIIASKAKHNKDRAKAYDQVIGES
jgi:lysozyme family protein